MRDEIASFEEASASISNVLRDRGDQRPSDLLREIESAESVLSGTAIRGAIWTLVNRGEVEITSEGRLRLSEG